MTWEWNWKTIAAAATMAAAVLSASGSWVALGFPLLATRGWTLDRLRPVIYQQLLMRRHIDDLDLFQWQRTNPNPSPPVQDKINQIKAEIDRLDKQIAAMSDP